VIKKDWTRMAKTIVEPKVTGDWQQVRIRLPVDVIQRLKTDDASFNSRIVDGLRQYLNQRQNLEQIAREAALCRAFATCCSVAETITGRPLDDPATLKCALSMIRTLVEKLDSEVKSKGGQPAAQRAIEALLKLGSLDTDQRAGFNAGLSVLAT
jgi:hypothetical protein